MDVAVTERTQAKEEHQKLEANYRAIFDAANDAIFIHDIETGAILDINQRMCEVFGYSREEARKLNVQDLSSGEHPYTQEEALRRIKEAVKGEPQLFEWRAKDKSGRLFWMEVDLKCAVISGKKRLLAILRDITERKQIEERQAELLQEVENVNHKLNDFAYIVSHELKAPLRGIHTLVEWISTDYTDKLDEKGKEQMNLLSDHVVRMHDLIDGILRYSKVEHIRGEQTRVDLNKVVQNVIEMLKPPENVVIEVENELPTVLCEQTRIMQVFQNLLSNAVKHMDKPQGQIKIGCVEEDKFLKFSVADNGSGIEEKDFERIFQIFQTLPAHGKLEGTGIGLSLVKKIVETYGGRVWVESELTSGSTFFFTFPRSLSVVKNDT
jgi:PAS domain S-box-containing protein